MEYISGIDEQGDAEKELSSLNSGELGMENSNGDPNDERAGSQSSDIDRPNNRKWLNAIESIEDPESVNVVLENESGNESKLKREQLSSFSQNR